MTWLTDQQRAFQTLVGRQVTGWRGIEMALRDDGPRGVEFSDPAVPFLQLVELALDTADDVLTVSTHGGFDGLWGPQRAGRTWPEPVWDGIYRARDLVLPIGRVEAVEVKIEEATLAEVLISMGAGGILLVAGEVYERWDGTLDIHRFDESVLVFGRPDDVDLVQWIPPRPSSWPGQ